MGRMKTIPSRPKNTRAGATSLAEAAEIAAVRGIVEKKRSGKTLTRSEVKRLESYESSRARASWWARAAKLPQEEVLELLDSTREQARRWKAAGLHVETEGRRVYYDLAPTLAWLRRRWQGGVELDAGEATSKRAAEIKLLIRREAALQLKMQLLSGELVHRAEVEKAIIGRILTVKGGLLALRRTLAPAILELGADATIEQVERLIWDFTRALLNGFASSPIVLDDGQKVVRIHFPDGVKSDENENTTDPRGK